ncbi:MAG: N-acetyl-alpha-D-glucosaminyl L-malate synthase BshA [Actinomycetota bacterium]|nr:N-acetyl-alpha-D-glucosaminyl L-malate synthase BshA [Actinomycetota bacterium]
MKIGITCYPTYGGSGVVASELGMELAKLGNEVHFISYEQPFKITDCLKNIYFHEVDVLEYPLFKYPPYSLSLSVKMAEIFEEHNLDIMHVHYAIPHAASAFLTKKIMGENSNFKFITTLHGTDITIVGNHHSFYKLTKFCIENSNAITCVSNYLKYLTENTFRIDKEIQVIYNFINTREYIRNKSDKENMGIVKRGETGIIHISNFRAVKNIKNVIEIFNRVSKEVKAKLLLVGEGPDTALAKEMAKKFKIEEKIVFLSRKDNVIPFLNSCDLYLLPSRSESFGVSALEALSCGLPVIGTEIGGLKEVVINGSCGFLHDPDDVEKMSESAIELLINKSKFEEFSFNARKRALDFDSKKIIAEYIQLYERIIKE